MANTIQCSSREMESYWQIIPRNNTYSQSVLAGRFIKPFHTYQQTSALPGVHTCGKLLNFKAPGCINITICYSDPVTDNIAEPKCANWPLWLSDNFIFSSNLSQFGFKLQPWHKSCSLTLVAAGSVSLNDLLYYMYFLVGWSTAPVWTELQRIPNITIQTATRNKQKKTDVFFCF